MAPSGVRGIGEMLSLENALRTIDPAEAAREAAFATLARAYRRMRSRIPRDTGALYRSLANRSDRAHFEQIHLGALIYGSLLVQAEYQAHRIPNPNPDPIIRAIGGAVWSKLLR